MKASFRRQMPDATWTKAVKGKTGEGGVSFNHVCSASTSLMQRLKAVFRPLVSVSSGLGLGLGCPPGRSKQDTTFPVSLLSMVCFFSALSREVGTLQIATIIIIIINSTVYSFLPCTP